MPVESPRKTLMERLTLLYTAQRQLAEAFPPMAEAACSYKVAAMLQAQAQHAQEALEALVAIYQLISAAPARGKSPEVRKCLAAANRLIELETDLEAVDAGLVEITQRLQEHVLDASRQVAELAPMLGVRELPQAMHDLLKREVANAARLEAMAVRIPQVALAV